MWYEILPAMGIMVACVAAYEPLSKGLAYIFFGRWSGTDFFHYRDDFALHLHDRNLTGKHHILRGVEVIDDANEE
ncbi:NADH dehydrogenase (ubiquinone) 1 alpha subcomplex subunit 1 [Paragonimus westermani]|uniref:NADH dehydrogenase (Ubiquinone) 1 alpha subcomplex subunit 1 n=1 Tax=Paragonimus westermani TaxID=34504 RepID=A0A5J4NJA4_9TREM|nr:NADH dehydrogenase (ubiquinone) 1 alpha subcomplex subunit 1 [Paragonimus westermani]